MNQDEVSKNSPEQGVRDGEAAQPTVTEDVRLSGAALTEKVRALLREGNVRRITVKNSEGNTLIHIPLTIGAVGTLLLPLWVGLGVLAALAADLTLSVERRADVQHGGGEVTQVGERPSSTQVETRDTPPDHSQVG